MLTLSLVLILAAAAYALARRRAHAVAGGREAELHSRSGYHAWYAALLAAGPALGLWALWRLAEPLVLRWAVLRSAPPEVQAGPEAGFFLVAVRRLAEVRPLASG